MFEACLADPYMKIEIEVEADQSNASVTPASNEVAAPQSDPLPSAATCLPTCRHASSTTPKAIE
jgi:hypothetical protein